MTKREDQCRYCGGLAIDLINHELHCLMNNNAKESLVRRRDIPQTNVELYIWLMDMLQEFQLPGGKFDGHGLITALANAKRFDVIKSENAELRESLSYCLETMRVERNEYGEWVSRKPGSRYREAADAAHALLSRVQS